MSEELAKLFHATHVRLAPDFGYGVGMGRMVAWEKLPERDRRLLTAVADIIELHFFGGDPQENDDELGSEFYAQSGYGHNSRQPFVALSYNGRKLALMPPEDATALAHNLLACAEASLSDAFLIRFMQDSIGIELNEVAGLLREFRRFRDAYEEKNK